MKAKYKELLDKSIAAAVASIDIYNKPDFKYRDESFVILLMNSWELLLKAKILKDNKNRLSSLYIRQGASKRWKKSRTGNPLTIDLLAASRMAGVDVVVAENLAAICEIRDTAVHFCNNEGIKYMVFTLGVAAMKNYQHLCSLWFEKSLADLHFFILPIGFSHAFKTFQDIDLLKSPPVVANLVKAVSDAQLRVGSSESYHFACEIRTSLVSAKKFADAADLTVKIDQSSTDNPIVITQTKGKLDQYPLSFKELLVQIKKLVPDVKQNAILAIIKSHGMKSKKEYSAYSFRNKAQETQFAETKKLPNGTASIYNDDAVRFIVHQLQSGQTTV